MEENTLDMVHEVIFTLQFTDVHNFVFPPETTELFTNTQSWQSWNFLSIYH